MALAECICEYLLDLSNLGVQDLRFYIREQIETKIDEPLNRQLVKRTEKQIFRLDRLIDVAETRAEQFAEDLIKIDDMIAKLDAFLLETACPETSFIRTILGIAKTARVQLVGLLNTQILNVEKEVLEQLRLALIGYSDEAINFIDSYLQDCQKYLEESSLLDQDLVPSKSIPTSIPTRPLIRLPSPGPQFP